MKNKADLLVLGNVITMDEHKPYAEAVAVKGDRILYVGAAKVARKLCDAHTKVLDYGKNSVYPGFLEAHCHCGGAGYKMIGVANMKQENTLEECVRIMKKYMEEHPDKQIINGSGFATTGEEPTAAMFDAICPDKIMVCSSVDGHSMWLNTKAMEEYGIDREAAEKWGPQCVVVDEKGNPTGYISEGPVFEVRAKSKVTVGDMKESVMAWQDFALSKGYTGVYNAGMEVTSKCEPEAFYELEKEGKLKMYTYGGSVVRDNTDTPEEDLERIAREAAEHNSKHVRIIGAKVFCDGVVEAHTAWMLDDYLDQPGYKGVPRFNDHEKMVRLLEAAQARGMNVHVHSIGDAATKAWVDAIAQAQASTGDYDMRNALAHLQAVSREDIKRIADNNIIAVVGIMWLEAEPGFIEQEIMYIGEEKAIHAYPAGDLAEQGAVVVSHSDYPVSPGFSVPETICQAVIGYLPSHGSKWARGGGQQLSREESLKALTTNVAYSWHAEDLMGSLEIGKLANITVFDADFMKDDMADIEKAQCLATIVDGELVYKSK